MRATCASTRDRPWRFVCRAARSGLSHLYAAKKLQFSTRRTVRRGFRARTGRAAQLAGQLRLIAARGGLCERLAHLRGTGHGDLCAEPCAQQLSHLYAAKKTTVLHAPNRAQRLSRPHRPCCATGWPASPDRRARRTSRATCASAQDRPWRFVRRAARTGLSHLYAAKKLQFSTRRTVRRGFRARAGCADNPSAGDSTASGAGFCTRASRADNPTRQFSRATAISPSLFRQSAL